MYNNKILAVMEHNERRGSSAKSAFKYKSHEQQADKTGSVKHWQIKKTTKV